MEEKKRRPDWYLKTIRRFYQYPLDKRRLEVLQARLEAALPSATAQYSLAPAYTGPGDQTGNIASNRLEIEKEMKELMLRVKEIEIVLSSFNFEGKKLIEMRYFQGQNTDFYVYTEMHMAQATYFRFRDSLIHNSAVILGYYAERQMNILELARGK